MILYFVNGSRQKKFLLQSDFVDDIYDVIIGFFEEHGKFPHILTGMKKDDKFEVHFDNSCEVFLIEDADNDNQNELMNIIKEEWQQ